MGQLLVGGLPLLLLLGLLPPWRAAAPVPVIRVSKEPNSETMDVTMQEYGSKLAFHVIHAEYDREGATRCMHAMPCMPCRPTPHILHVNHATDREPTTTHERELYVRGLPSFPP